MGARGPKPKYTDVSCPNETCSFFALTERDNIRSRGTYETKSGDIVRKFECTNCKRVFNSRTGTAYQWIHSSPKDLDLAVSSLNEGSGIRATGRIVGHSKDTIQKWCMRSGIHCARVSTSAEDEVEASYIQFDELTAFVKKNQRR